MNQQQHGPAKKQQPEMESFLISGTQGCLQHQKLAHARLVKAIAEAHPNCHLRTNAASKNALAQRRSTAVA
jgi:hypothetical protein